MRQTLLLLLAALLTVGLCCCGNKKESKDIITKMPEKPKKQSGPMTMSSGDIPAKTVGWVGGNVTIHITRIVDKELPLIEDASGNKYYDNKVRLLITRENGSSFFDKTFTRNDFKKYLSTKFARKWGLTGFNFDRIDNGKLLFAIAIGSPDEMADNEFVPLTLAIDSKGGTSVITQTADDDDAQQDE